MTAEVQAPVPGLRDARGLVLRKIREGPDSPPWGTEAWKESGGVWSYDLGGRWLERGNGKLFWEWLT